MESETLHLLIEQLRAANASLTAQVAELTAQLQAKGDEDAGKNEPEPQSAEAPEAQSTPGADAAIDLLEKRREAARLAERKYVEPLRARGMSVGTSDDYAKYRASRG